MSVVETIARIRRDHLVPGKSIKAIARERGVSRNTVRKVLRGEETAFRYTRGEQPLPQMGPFREPIEWLLEANERRSRRERLTLVRLFEALQGEGYARGYDAVRRHARRWQQARGSGRYISRPAIAEKRLSLIPMATFDIN